ncbi:DUF5793 family protein [Haloglomus litoreum]|uniref:DUF5793 family protein n=1 Tax=Haloglomus litoreum TaxID=3034026 RepID=UPI0023E8BE64|nr:DUF5793 family protein [Haloglomus sp. DT116]
MRRDYFTLDVRNMDADGPPTAHIEFDGPADQLVDRLTGDDDEPLPPEELDVALRLQTPADAEDASGVVAVTNRVTGAYVLELNVDADDVFRFIDAAREFGQETDREFRYRVRVTVDGEELLDHEMNVFLVYDPDGELLRGRSLIPSGVEL